MGDLIDDSAFSRLGRSPMVKQPVNTGDLVRAALAELKEQSDNRKIDLKIGTLPSCDGDAALLKQVWINLLSNALKYSRNRAQAGIEVGAQDENGQVTYFVRDNGAGFDMRYAGKLFGLSTVALRGGLRRHRRGAGHCAAHRATPRRPCLGRERSRPRSDPFFSPSLEDSHYERPQTDRIAARGKRSAGPRAGPARAQRRPTLRTRSRWRATGPRRSTLFFARARTPGAHVRGRPQVILLDLKLPKIDGLEVLRRLKGDPRTRRFR